jgi:PTS system fructose-specific IIA component
MSKHDLRPLYTLLKPELVKVGMVASDKIDAIGQIVALLDGQSAVEDISEVLDAVLKREQLLSTGVGKGLALPHAKTDEVSEIVAALAILETPISFDSMDGEPINIMLLLVAPSDATMNHVRLLGHVSRLLNREEFRHRLAHAADASAALRCIEEEELRMQEE